MAWGQVNSVIERLREAAHNLASVFGHDNGVHEGDWSVRSWGVPIMFQRGSRMDLLMNVGQTVSRQGGIS